MTNKTAETPVLVDVNGYRAPDAAKAGVGATTRREIEQATDARREQKPGDYRNDRN